MLDIRPQSGRAAVWVLIAAVVLLILLNVPLPLYTRLGRAASDLAHAPIFFAFGMLVSTACQRLTGRKRPLVAWLLTVAFGFVSEWGQHLTGRHPSWSDFQADALGAAAGVVWMGILQSPPWRVRVLEQGGAIVLFVAAIWHAGADFVRAFNQWADMPRLASFEDSEELARWSFQEARGYCDNTRATHERQSLRLELDAGVYPGAAWEWGPPDWSAYRELVFDACADGTGPLDLVVKIYDLEHNQEPDDRFHRVIRLEPSWRQIRINLAEVAAAPRERTLDLRRIVVLQFFAVRPERPRTVYLDHLHLE